MPISASDPMVADASASDHPVVRIRGLKKSFGTVNVFDGLDLDVRRGDVVSIIGPSGSGKTTLLRCINALETYDGGSVQIDAVEVGFRDGGRRRRSERELALLRAETGMVFQLFYLFPHLTAAENVMLGLRKVRGIRKAQAREIAGIPGVDALFAASSDLGNFSGYKQGDPDYERLINVEHDAALSAGKRLCGPFAWLDRPDFTCFQNGSETAAIERGVATELGSLKDTQGKPEVGPYAK